ncbi:hypothetical protein A1O1_05161 [Capronia coronata CBS 617.96]|uniref:Uncharacterized protein n=1 Tax=Capronia coronata CBS 617.96 TaxID=1182541 RepID=W9YG39_9EURO|nr:uncharacterized protein A1O1_05161 [Capronia coronata CBS 617.96]EXJ88231.1 hypothetical protein A1O1_05161 [Capronia coronata CBS 617.96]
MAQTPAHIQYAHGPDRRISAYRDEFVKLQSLYLERRYKQCIALCEQLQRPGVWQHFHLYAPGWAKSHILTSEQIHPVHEVFLCFYHAISYESLGLIAHDYSSNKLRFLDFAKESYNLALKSLPLPYVSTEAGKYEQNAHSPLASVFAAPALHHVNAGIQDTPSKILASGLVESASACSIYSTDSMISEPYTVLDSSTPSSSSSKKYDPTTPRAQGALKSLESDHLRVPTTPAPHKSRLSQSMSLEHQLADDLVPSPLFSRKSKQARITESVPDVTHRPLPPLPFGHQSNFEVRGSRIVQVLRKTAVDTLIAQYEGCLPLSPSPTQTLSPTVHRNAGTVTESPVTPRFRAIRDAFTPNPVNGNLEAYLSSPDLSEYNASLADFRMQLRNHMIYLDKEISRVHKAQVERTATKALCKTRFASFWSFEHLANTPKRKCRPLQDIDATSSPDSGVKITGENEPRAQASNERIDKLRLEGWHVRKEDHGFKGVQWYEDLSRRVETELAAAARKASGTG